MNGRILLKMAGAATELGKEQLRTQQSLAKMMRDPGVSRDEYIQAGIADERKNIAKKKALPWYKRGFGIMNMMGLHDAPAPIAGAIGTMALRRYEKQPDSRKAKRYGKAWDTYNPNSKVK